MAHRAGEKSILLVHYNSVSEGANTSREESDLDKSGSSDQHAEMSSPKKEEVPDQKGPVLGRSRRPCSRPWWSPGSRYSAR